MTGLQTLCLFATGYLMSRLLLAAGLHNELVRWILGRARGRVSHVVLGVMAIACALSAVVPNALTVLALLPVLARLRGLTARTSGEATTPAPSPGQPPQRDPLALYGTLLAMALIYGANLGGVGSLLGSPANLYLLVSLRIYDVPGRESLHFLSWLAFGFPMALTLVLLFWGVLWVTAPSCMAERLPEAAGELAQGDPTSTGTEQWRGLALRFLGLWGLGWLGILAAGLLLGLGKPVGAAATPVLLSGSFLGQTFGVEVLDAVALALSSGFALALFAWPVHAAGDRARLLGVMDLTRELPWRGLLVAAAVLALLLLLAWAGTGTWLQAKVPSLLPDARSPFLFTLVLVTITIFATEVLNNTTVSTVMFPIVASAAPTLGADPLLVMLGVSLASTCAFMTPLATPVNALALASLRGISYRTFLFGGLLTNLVAALWLTLWLTFAVSPLLRLFGGP